MVQLNENSRTINDPNKKVNTSYQNGNAKIHFIKGPNGQVVSVIRPAFIKITDLE